SWAGFSFELLCLSHAKQIRKKLGISGVTTYTSSWRSRTEEADGAQIDLIIDRNDHVINLCEMKFSKREFTITKDYDRILRNKMATFAEETQTKKAIHLTLITTYGVKRNEYWGNIQGEIKLDDLFS
ncbi:MAG: ATP-binding protein, partial [Dysgonamonadaceae bacterium]|nr:ATP-binding protein [Dysgonamonadaceae bacterium]